MEEMAVKRLTHSRFPDDPPKKTYDMLPSCEAFRPPDHEMGSKMSLPARIDLAGVGPGVAWAFDFDEDGRGRPLSGDSSIDLTHGRRFVWVHLVLGNVRTREWIGAQQALPPEVREVFLSKDRHPSLHWGGEALWGTLHDVRHEDQATGMEATDLRFALWPQFLLTARHHAARSAMAVKDQAEKGATFEDSAALFERLLIAAADSIGEAAQGTANELDRIEDRVLSDAVSDENTALLRLRRGISRQERLVQAAHSVLAQLEQNRGESVLQSYRDLGSRVRQRVDAFAADLHLQAERARLLQEEMAAQLATATNRNLFALTVVTTVLLPPAFVTGYFGMNTKALPFADSDYGTVYATILCLVAASVVYLLIRRYRTVS
jgi:zinc transporter